MRRFGASAAWNAATAVAAAAYGVSEDVLKAESRGRGPRPPRAAWEAKKMAVHLAVLVSGCGYAELAATIGFHRDTIASHCAEMRGRDSDSAEVSSEALEALTRARLERKMVDDVAAARAHLEALQLLAGDLVTGGVNLSSSDRHPPHHPTETADDGNVIRLRGTAARPRPVA